MVGDGRQLLHELVTAFRSLSRDKRMNTEYATKYKHNFAEARKKIVKGWDVK